MKEQNNSKYIFKSITDAVFYFVISVIYPVYSIIFEYFETKNSNNIDEHLLMSMIIGCVFFYATYGYDFVNKFEEAENKVRNIYKFLLTFAIVYILLAIASFIFLIFIIQSSKDMTKSFDYIIIIFIISAMPIFYPIIEIISRIKSKYKGKISKASV